VNCRTICNTSIDNRDKEQGNGAQSAGDILCHNVTYACGAARSEEIGGCCRFCYVLGHWRVDVVRYGIVRYGIVDYRYT